MDDLVFYIIAGIFLIYFTIKSVIILIKMKTYIKVKGVVTHSNTKYYIDNEGASTVAHNKYHFEYNGKIYDIEDYGGNTKLKVGDEVYLYISKKNPDNYLKPGKVHSLRYYILLIIVIILFFLGQIFF